MNAFDTAIDQLIANALREDTPQEKLLHAVIAKKNLTSVKALRKEQRKANEDWTRKKAQLKKDGFKKDSDEYVEAKKIYRQTVKGYGKLAKSVVRKSS